MCIFTLYDRIHFALNCGAASCPPIRVFTSKNVERGMIFVVFVIFEMLFHYYIFIILIFFFYLYLIII